MKGLEIPEQDLTDECVRTSTTVVVFPVPGGPCNRAM